MDVHKALRDLYQEKKRLDSVIASLEARQKANVHQIAKTPKRRGRKSMSPDERQAVSRRMAEYWAARRGTGVVLEMARATA